MIETIDKVSEKRQKENLSKSTIRKNLGKIDNTKAELLTESN